MPNGGRYPVLSAGRAFYYTKKMVTASYLDVISTASLRRLNTPNFKTITVKKMPKLVCPNCKTLLGIPMLHWEGRLAFRLIRGNWTKQKLTNETIKKFRESVERESS